MKEIQGGNQEWKIPVEGTNELWQLTEQYNDMVDALHQQREEVQRNFEEKTLSIQQRNQAERQALESQIDAHFICNTLNAINYNVLEAGNFEVAESFHRQLWRKRFLALKRNMLSSVKMYRSDLP